MSVVFDRITLGLLNLQTLVTPVTSPQKGPQSTTDNQYDNKINKSGKTTVCIIPKFDYIPINSFFASKL